MTVTTVPPSIIPPRKIPTVIATVMIVIIARGYLIQIKRMPTLMVLTMRVMVTQMVMVCQIAMKLLMAWFQITPMMRPLIQMVMV